MNKIKTAAAAIALLGTTGAYASSYVFENPDNRDFLGVRIGLDISSAGNGGGHYNNKPGFFAGAVYNIPVWKNLYFEPGLMFFYNTFGTTEWDSFKVEVPVKDENGIPMLDPDTGNPMTEEVEKSYQKDGSMRNFGFRVPLLVGYHFDFAEDVQLHVYTGPQFNLSLLARYHKDEVRVPEVQAPSESYSIFGTGGFKHFDMQWKFGVGLAYQSYYVGLSGSWGIIKMKDATDELPRDLDRNLFSISLGYNF